MLYPFIQQALNTSQPKSRRQQQRNAKRLLLMTNELGVEELIEILKNLNPAQVSKLKQAWSYLESG